MNQRIENVIAGILSLDSGGRQYSSNLISATFLD